LFAFNGVEKPIRTQQGAEAKTGQSEQNEEEYEPLIGAGYNVSTNANRLAASASRTRPMNTNNGRYDRQRRGHNERRSLDKEQQTAVQRRDDAATSRPIHQSHRQPRRHAPTTDDDRR